MIRAFEIASGRTVPYNITVRRPDDIAECWANPRKAEFELSWKTKRNHESMMVFTSRW